jgi:cholesterol transport system auxiliary component
MKRRAWLATAATLAGCSVLPEQPYLQRREWPLLVRRPTVLPPRTGRPVLLVRSVQPAPGLETRGLQWVLPDGSLHVDYYEQWAVPPAQAVEDSLRQWLADAGLFAAVVAPGSRLSADLVLEAELVAFVGDPRAGVARAGLALVLMDQRPKPVRVLLQKTAAATAPLSGVQPPVVVQALVAALGEVLREVERDVATAVSR